MVGLREARVCATATVVRVENARRAIPHGYALAMRWVLATLLWFGCGRIEFENRTYASDAPSDAPSDAVDGACADGFTFVTGDTMLGTRDFCAMTFEARARDMNGQIVADGCVVVNVDDCAPNGLSTSTHRAASVAAGKPWRGLDALAAYGACADLGAGHTLMTNAEWMTIARAAERTGSNWSGGSPYAGVLVEGATDDFPVLGITDPENPYSDTGYSANDPPGAGWEQRRTIDLPDGRVLWDLPAHLQEWIDWTYDERDYAGAPPCSGGELPALACAGYAPNDYNSASGTLDSSVGVGRVLAGSGNTARRGGQLADRAGRLAGIYALNMNRFTDQTFPATGFRCVYRLP
jgi:hypothetical protein